MVNIAGKVPATWLLLASPQRVAQYSPRLFPRQMGGAPGVGGAEEVQSPTPAVARWPDPDTRGATCVTPN